MSLNVVNVTFAADNSPADPSGTYAEGNVLCVPSGLEWPDTSNNPIVPAVIHGYLLNGTVTLAVVATDNFAAGVLTWDFIVNIRGMPTVNVPGVQVLFASGANQNGWTILQAAGWTPIAQP